LVSLVLRTPFKVDVVRDRGALARIVAGGKIENTFRLQIMNATESEQAFTVSAQGLNGLALQMDSPTVLVGPTESRWVAVRLQLPYEAAAPGSHPIQFNISAAGQAEVREKSTFIVPR
jgi:polyferredoxin